MQIINRALYVCLVAIKGQLLRQTRADTEQLASHPETGSIEALLLRPRPHGLALARPCSAVTYGMGFARDVADRIAFFDEGMLVELRTPHYIFNKPSEDRIRMFLEQIIHPFPQ